MSALIGALRATMGLDSAAFEKGANSIIKQSRKMERDLVKMGKRMSDLGKTLSIAVTVPLAALGKAVTGLADDAKRMRNAANLAGEGFEDFQRHAYAAKSVGIEFEKLGDILKDTQDKVGDFVATGGGEMADFFENIAPKVGVTADMFRDLSGKDALQLYYDSLVKAGVSEKELVFYMESIADEATGLIPLLKDNGKAMKEMGANAAVISESDAAGLKRYTDAQLKLGNAFTKLKIAIANSGLIDIVSGFVESLASLGDRFAALPPGMQRFIVLAGALAAALGPVLLVVGGAVQAFAPFFAVLTTAASSGGVLVAAQAAFAGLAAVLGPVLVPLAALAAVGAVIYANWDKIGPALTSFWDAAKKALGPEIQAMVAELKQVLSDLWTGPLGDLLRASIRVLGLFAVEAIKAFGPELINVIKLLVQTLTELFRFIGVGVRTVKAIFEGDWKTAIIGAVQIFNRMFGGLPGYIAGVMERIVTAVRTWIVDKLNAIWDGAMERVEKVKKAFFGLYDAVVGHSYIPDMVTGIGKHIARLTKEMVTPSEQAADAVKRTFAEAADATLAAFDRLAGSIRGGGFLDILSSVIGMGMQLGSIGVFGKSVAANINAPRIPQYASGTSFHGGGMALVGERGPELVNLPRGSQVFPNGTGPATRVEVVPSAYFDTVVDGRVLRAAPGIASAGGKIGEARVAQRGQYQLR